MSAYVNAIGTTAWYAELARNRLKAQEERSAAHFAETSEIPELDLMPPCSICDGDLEYDESFYCGVCHVQWSSYGHDGERDTGSDE